MKRSNKMLAAAAMMAPLVAPAIAMGAAFTIDDSTTEGTVNFGLNDFEGGFSINGQLVQQGLQNGVTVPVSENNGPIAFAGHWIDEGASVLGTTTIVFVEAQDPSQVSDIFTYTIRRDGLATIAGTFTSDTEASLGSLASFLDGHPNAQVVVEGGDPVSFSAAFLAGSVQSDVDPVPEPTSMAVLGAALAGLGFARRGKKA